MQQECDTAAPTLAVGLVLLTAAPSTELTLGSALPPDEGQHPGIQPRSRLFLRGR